MDTVMWDKICSTIQNMILDVIKDNDPEIHSEIMGMIMSVYNDYDYEDVEKLVKTSKKKDLHSKVKDKMADVEKIGRAHV